MTASFRFAEINSHVYFDPKFQTVYEIQRLCMCMYVYMYLIYVQFLGAKESATVIPGLARVGSLPSCHGYGVSMGNKRN